MLRNKGCAQAYKDDLVHDVDTTVTLTNFRRDLLGPSDVIRLPTRGVGLKFRTLGPICRPARQSEQQTFLLVVVLLSSAVPKFGDMLFKQHVTIDRWQTAATISQSARGTCNCQRGKTEIAHASQYK